MNTGNACCKELNFFSNYILSYEKSSSLLDFKLLLKLNLNKAKSVQLQLCWMYLHIYVVDSE